MRFEGLIPLDDKDTDLTDLSMEASQASVHHEEDASQEPNPRKRLLPRDIEEEASKRRLVNPPSTDLSNGDMVCEECEIKVSKPYALRRHLETVHRELPRYICEVRGCKKLFTRRDTRKRHMDTMHGHAKLPCAKCGALVRKDGLREHLSTSTCREGANAVAMTLQSLAAKPLAQSSDRTGSLLTRMITGAPLVESPIRIWCRDDADKAPHDGPSGPGMIIEPQRHRIVPNADCQWNFTVPMSESKHTGIHENLSKGSLLDYSHLAPNSPKCSVPGPDLDETLGLELENMGDLVKEMQGCDYETWPINTRDLAYESALQGERFCGTFTSQLAPLNTTIGQFLMHGSLIVCKGISTMRYGGDCALCTHRLGDTAESVFRHVRDHVRHHRRPKFSCRVCGVSFVYESDWTFHERFSDALPGLQTCIVNSYQEHDDDWISYASNKDRQQFIDELRLWEMLQLQWYLANVDRFLRKTVFDGRDYSGRSSLCRGAKTAETTKETTRLYADFALHAAYSEVPQSHSGDTDVAGLTAKFERSSLRDGVAILL